jgi:hypothetical protein
MASIMRFDQWQNSSGVAMGTVLQVKSTSDNVAQSLAVTANTWTAWPSGTINVSITPFYSTSKILVMASLTIGVNANSGAFRLKRGSTAIGVGAQQGSHQEATAVTGYMNSADTNHTFRTIAATYLDSPATTSALTYSVDLMSESTIVYINRGGAFPDSSAVYACTANSSLTVMEIAQ